MSARGLLDFVEKSPRMGTEEYNAGIRRIYPEE